MSTTRTLWFELFLGLLAWNLLSMVLNRLPLQRSPLSFALVQAGVVLLFAGGWISRQYGFEGELMIHEGEGTSSLLLFEQEVVMTEWVKSEESGDEKLELVRRFPLPANDRWAGRILQEETPAKAHIEILNAITNGSIRTVLIPGSPDLGPGVDYRIAGRGAVIDSWLLADDPLRRSPDQSPIEVELLHFKQKEAFDSRAKALAAHTGVTLESVGNVDRLHIPLPDAVGVDFDAGDGVSVKVLTFFMHARVENDQLVDIPDATPNPAAELEIRRGDQVERHIVFSQFPEFGIHELAGSLPLSGRIRLNSARTEARALMTILCDPDGNLFTQVSSTSGRMAAIPLPSHRQAEVPGTPFKLTVNRFLPHATFMAEAVAAVTSGAEGVPLVKLRVVRGKLKSEFWLQPGSGMQVPILGEKRSLTLRRQRRELPFRIGLESFDVSHYPATHTAPDIISHVLVVSIDGRTAPRSAVVSTHQPLDYLGYRLLQDSFAMSEAGLPNRAVLSASYSPGVPYIYAAFLFLILGNGWYVLSVGPGSTGARRNSRDGVQGGRIEMILSPGVPVPKDNQENSPESEDPAQNDDSQHQLSYSSTPH